MTDKNPPHARVASVLAAEDARRKALIAHDIDALREIISPDLMYTHTSGKIDNAASFLASFKSETRYLKLERRDLKVSVHGPAAIMTGVAEITGQVGTDAPKTIMAQVIQVWIEEGSRWRLTWYQGTKLPQV